MRAMPLLRALVLGLALLSLPLAACGGGPRSYVMRGTQRDPGSDARLQIETLDGGNYLLTLTATNVTPAERIGTGNTVYLVWIRTPNGQTQMESQLAYQPEQRTGRATITTPQRRFTLMVTAERDASVSTPSDNVVLTQEVQL
ncbi:MAG: hypothetical protein OHK0013_37390 [Sandaracinaceae bacterium]